MTTKPSVGAALAVQGPIALGTYAAWAQVEQWRVAAFDGSDADTSTGRK